MRPVLTILCAFAAVTAIGVFPSFAQMANSDPMAVAKAINSKALNEEAMSRESSTKNSLKSKTVTAHKSLLSNAPFPDAENVFTQKYVKNTDIVEKIAADLETAFGQPKTMRGDVKLWEIKNVQKRLGQANHVTIMLGPNKQGEQELIIDQRGPSPRRLLPDTQAPFQSQTQSSTPSLIRRNLLVD